ncbi:MAG: hypothetical protein AB8H80_03710 [Planctomycetota bacterium]
MQRKSLITLATVGVAASLLAWLEPAGFVQASGGGGTGGSSRSAMIDSDGDFLPDVVEWVVLTDANNPDTDSDGIPDFVEVVEAGMPRHENMPLPPDQDMRLIITGPAPGSQDPRNWLHVFYRVLSPAEGFGATAVESFQAWFERPEWPGLKIPFSLMSLGEHIYRERDAGADHGIFIQLSVPLVSEQELSSLLPCTFWAESVVGGRHVQSGVKLVGVPSGIVTIVPFGDERFVMQALRPVPLLNPLVTESNRVCVLTLRELSSGPAGTSYEVDAADCEDANELECTTDCSNSVGWTITVPGGTEMLGGQ